MGEVVRDDSELCVECGRGNEQVSIWQQRAPSVQLCIQCSRTVNNAVCKGKDQTGLTQRVKGNFLSLGPLSLESRAGFRTG